MSNENKIIGSQAPGPSVYSGQLGPTGPAPLVPTGIKIRHGVRVQGVTGIAWVGGTGVGTGAGYQLGATGSTGFLLPEVFIRADDVRKVSVNAPQGMVRWVAT